MNNSIERIKEEELKNIILETYRQNNFKNQELSGNGIVGIKGEELKKLILEIYDYRDKIAKILDTAEVLVNDTKNYYKSLDGEMFRKKFGIFANNFDVLLKNVKGYGDDLEKVRNIYQ